MIFLIHLTFLYARDLPIMATEDKELAETFVQQGNTYLADIDAWHRARVLAEPDWDPRLSPDENRERIWTFHGETREMAKAMRASWPAPFRHLWQDYDGRLTITPLPTLVPWGDS